LKASSGLFRGIRVRESDRPLRGFDGIHRGLVAAVGQIHEHSKAVHLRHHFPTEGRQSLVLRRHAPEAHSVFVIVGELDDSHPESMIHGKHAQVPVDGACVLEAKNHSCTASDLGFVNVFHGPDLHDPIRVVLEEAIVICDEVHRLRKGMPRRHSAVEGRYTPLTKPPEHRFIEKVARVETVNDDRFTLQICRLPFNHIGLLF
jgi:hypothetical protein